MLYIFELYLCVVDDMTLDPGARASFFLLMYLFCICVVFCGLLTRWLLVGAVALCRVSWSKAPAWTVGGWWTAFLPFIGRLRSISLAIRFEIWVWTRQWLGWKTLLSCEKSISRTWTTRLSEKMSSGHSLFSWYINDSVLELLWLCRRMALKIKRMQFCP